MTDLLLNFVSAYIDDETGELKVDLKEIAMHYLKTWLLFDLASSLPWDRMFCSAVDGADSNSVYSRAVKILRLIKVLRFVRMLRIAGRLDDLLGSWASDIIRLLKFLGILLLCGHICACIWHGVIATNGCRVPAADAPSSTVVCGCEGDDSQCQEWNWLLKYDPAVYRGNSSSARYLVSVYYSVVTLTTLGYGDVLPTNQVGPPHRDRTSV
jgi:potassium voltage-gated channel Eag-related subfamily H protein 7